MQVLSVICDVILLGCAGTALAMISPTAKPYAFTGCAIMATYGAISLYANALDKAEDTQKIQEVVGNIMVLVPLPLVNIELYLVSETSNIGLGHCLYIVPYILEVCFEISQYMHTPPDPNAEPAADAAPEKEQDNALVLKTLTQLGSIWSLVYIGVNDSKNLYLGMAGMAFFYIFVPHFVEHYFEGHGENCHLLGASGFCLLTIKAVEGQAAA